MKSSKEKKIKKPMRRLMKRSIRSGGFAGGGLSALLFHPLYMV